MDTSLEWKIVVGQKRFTSGHHTVEGEQSWGNHVTDFMKSRNMEEEMSRDRHLWRLGVDGLLLAVQILYIYIYIYIYIIQVIPNL